MTIPARVLQGAQEEATKRAIQIVQGKRSSFERYQNDPVGFGREVLKQEYTPDIVRVMESVRDNRVTICPSANSTGKTHAAASIATWFYKTYQDAKVFTTAAPPEDNLRKLLWGELSSLMSKNPGLFETDAIGVLQIARKPPPPAREPTSFITGVRIPTSGSEQVRESKFSGKHAPHLLFIVDEGDAVPPEIYKGIESCMTGPHTRLLVLFNPRARIGPMWQMERDGSAKVVRLSALTHPNVTSGEQIIPNAVTREDTVRRIGLWSRPLTKREEIDNECFEVPEFLVGCRAKDGKGEWLPPLNSGWRKITNFELCYMTFGVYPIASEYQLISQSWIDAARTRWDLYVAEYGEIPPEGVAPIQGVDVAEYGIDANVSTLRYGGWVAPPSRWKGVDPVTTGDKAADIYHQFGVRRAYVDGTGLGAGTPPQMRRKGCNAISVKVASKPEFTTEQGEFSMLKDQLAWQVREWLRTDPGAMLPPNERLLEELTTYLYKQPKNKIVVSTKDWIREKIGRSSDDFDSLCLTFAEEAKIGGSDVKSATLEQYEKQLKDQGTEVSDLRKQPEKPVVEKPTEQPEPEVVTEKKKVLCEYLSANIGQHLVVGPATREQYGYYGGGAKFDVWLEDVEARPDLFSVC